jgi:ribosomal protein S10
MRIELTSSDHHLIDKATQTIVRRVSKNGRKPVAMPMPVTSDTHDDGFVESEHRRVIDIWSASPELVQTLTHIQLPEGIQVTVTEAG